MDYLFCTYAHYLLFHLGEMYIDPFTFHYVLISASPNAVTSHHLMSFRITFVSERGGRRIPSLGLLFYL